MEYKTQRCNDPQFAKTGQCSRGPICWQYHGDDKCYRNGQSQNMEQYGLKKNSHPPTVYQIWAEGKILSQAQNAEPIQQAPAVVQSPSNQKGQWVPKQPP